LTCTATGPGGVQTFRRAVKVNIAAPVAAIAAIADSDSLGSHTLDASGSTGTGLAYAWDTYGPQADPAIVDDADPTTTCTSTATSGAGQYTVVLNVTDDFGRVSTAEETWAVGQGRWVLIEDIDLTAGALQDVKAGGAGSYTVDGRAFTCGNVSATSACTLGGGIGYSRSFDTADRYATLQSLWSAIPDYSDDNDYMIQVYRTAGTTSAAQQTVRLGWYGAKECGCEFVHGSGVHSTTNFGGWVDGSNAAVDPTVLGVRRNRGAVQALHSTAAGAVAPDDMTLTGHIGLLQDGNDSACILGTDTIDGFTHEFLTNAAWTEIWTAWKVWRRL